MTDLDRLLVAEVEQARADLRTLCQGLVAAPSVNPPGDTRQVAGLVQSYLRQRGVAAEQWWCEPTMPNVVARVTGAVPGPHLVLNAHLDTMEPGDLAAWTVPPFQLTVSDGRYYGLGMGNMKGGLAAMCLTVVLLQRHREVFGGQVTFTAVADECVFGDNGAAYLLKSKRTEVLGDALISGEGPGDMRMAVGEKGIAWYTVTASGDGGHASRARVGQSAISRLSSAVLALERALDGRATPPSHDLGDFAARDDEGSRLSVNVGTVAGGTFISQLPTRATAELDVRLPPGITISDVEAELDRVLRSVPGVGWRRIKGWEANWTGLDAPLIRIFGDAVARVRGTPAVPVIRLPASDASRWRALGVPAVCFGPQPTLSSGVDDYAWEQDVVDCAKVYCLAARAFLQQGVR